MSGLVGVLISQLNSVQLFNKPGYLQNTSRYSIFAGESSQRKQASRKKCKRTGFWNAAFETKEIPCVLFSDN